MLKEVIKQEVGSVIQSEYPYVKVPQVVIGKVTKGGRIINLKILDEYENVDEEYAEIPEVKVPVEYESGDNVVVAFLYGKLELPCVLRKWEGC